LADLVLRLKDSYDGAEPSGNSLMLLALLRLARIKGREDFQKSAERGLQVFASKMAGAGLPQMLVAQMFAMGPPMEIVVAGPPKINDVEMTNAIHRRFLPNAVLMCANIAPQPMPVIENRMTVYVCENYACQLPVNTVEQLEERLNSLQ